MENKKEDWVFSECKEYRIEYLDQVNANPSIHLSKSLCDLSIFDLSKFNSGEISGTKIKYNNRNYDMIPMLPYGLEKLWEKNIGCARKL